MPSKRTHIQPGQTLELDLTPVERKTILDELMCLPTEYEAMLKKVHPEQPLLLTLDELEDFSGYIAAESNHTTNKKLRTILDRAFTKMADLLDQFTEEEPTAKKTGKPPTKKAIAKERDEAERQQKISDQAVFLATWAAGVLQAAEQHGAKNKRLESFVLEDLDRVVLTTLPAVRTDIQKRIEAGNDDFTPAEVGGMLMAVAEELCEAPMNQQIGMLMVANALMSAMQKWLGETMGREFGKAQEPHAKRPRASKKKRPKEGPDE